MKKYLLLMFVAIATLGTSCVKSLDEGTPSDTLKQIELGKDTLSMFVGQTEHLTVDLTPSTYDPALLKWNSSDSTIISVTNNGTVLAKKLGTSTITISNADNTIAAHALVNVIERPDSLKMGLIAYYPFNNSAADSSGHANNGTINNITPTANRFGTANSAYYFNGVNSFIQVADKPELRLNNTDFTINMWVNLDEYYPGSGSALLAKNNGPYQKGWNCSVTGSDNRDTYVAGNPFYNVSGGGDPYAAGNTVLGIGHWKMMTVIYNLSANKISFYVDGAFTNEINNIPTPNANTIADLFIGKNSYNDPNGLTPDYYLKGKLDDIRIYKRAINHGEITKLFTLTY